MAPRAAGLRHGVWRPAGRQPRPAGLNQGCGMRKCARTVRTRITGTGRTILRDIPLSRPLARGRSRSPTMTVASSATRMPALINDARTGSKCGGHIPGKPAAHAQPGRTGCAAKRTSKPRMTAHAATTGDRVAPCVWMGMLPDYRSGTCVARRSPAGPASGKAPGVSASTSSGSPFRRVRIYSPGPVRGIRQGCRGRMSCPPGRSGSRSSCRWWSRNSCR